MEVIETFAAARALDDGFLGTLLDLDWSMAKRTNHAMAGPQFLIWERSDDGKCEKEVRKSHLNQI